MKILDQIALRMPVTWITTQELPRTVDHVAKGVGDRPVYRYDVMHGLLQYSPEKGWKRVVVEEPEIGAHGISDEGEAFQYLIRNTNDAVCLMRVTEQVVNALLGMFDSTLSDYREAFFSNNPSKLPVQFVLISHEDTVNAPLRRMVDRLDHDLPTQKELVEVLSTIKAEITLDDSADKIARAGVGLSENEFISTSLVSARENGKITANYVQTRKREILSNANILDVRTPELTLNDLGGLDEAKKLVRSISWMWSNPAEVEALDLSPLRRLMLVGVPGVGKSMICEAIASDLRVDLGKGGVSSSLSKWVGESEANMRRTFATLRQMAPIVFWIDEFGRDMSGGMSSGNVDGGTTDRVHGEFLTGLQELPEDIFLAAAANRIDALPPEMLRADRFDRIMFVGFPTDLERQEIFRIHLGKLAQRYDVTRLAHATPFFTGAEIKALIKEVKFEVGTSQHRAPSTEEIEKAAPHVKGRVWINHRDTIMQMYQRALTEWHWASTQQHQEAQQVIQQGKNPVTMPTGSYSPSSKKGMKFGNAG